MSQAKPSSSWLSGRITAPFLHGVITMFRPDPHTVLWLSEETDPPENMLFVGIQVLEREIEDMLRKC